MSKGLMKANYVNVKSVDSISISSSWRNSAPSKEMETQTAPELYEFIEKEMQSGKYTSLQQYSVSSKSAGKSLLEYLVKKSARWNGEQYLQLILDGKVTIDYMPCNDPSYKLEEKDFIEICVASLEQACQVVPSELIKSNLNSSSSSSSSSSAKTVAPDSKNNGDEEYDEYGDDFDDIADSKEDGKDTNGNTSKIEEASEDKGSKNDDFTPMMTPTPGLNAFLQKVKPMVTEALIENSSTTAFDSMSMLGDNNAAIDADARAWRRLSVDLERTKVVFPSWTGAKHYSARILRASMTRNKDRIYDIIFHDDGSSLQGVKEEHIRVANTDEVREEYWNEQMKRLKSLRVGMRVHVKVAVKSRRSSQRSKDRGAKDDDSSSKTYRFVPGRISVVNDKGKTYDIEAEGGKMVTAVERANILVGLDEGMQVDSRRPIRQTLNCTGVAWSCTGSSVMAAYGRTDVAGWCDLPGAVCVWNVFGHNADTGSPDMVLDHPSCINCISTHPEKPSVIAAGSFNGEVIVWDTSTSTNNNSLGSNTTSTHVIAVAGTEEPIGVSPIVEYCHKEPVTAVSWAWDQVRSDWSLISVGADGKILTWNIDNKLDYPVKGARLFKPGVGSKSNRKEYPLSYGLTSMAVSGGLPTTGTAGGVQLWRRPQWMLIGQEGGAVVRAQVSKVLVGNDSPFDRATFKEAQRQGIEPYKSVRARNEDNDSRFSHVPHIGPVTSVDCSSFHRSLFLTAGQDGVVQLCHVHDSKALLQWEPSPKTTDSQSSGSASSSQRSFHALVCARFSPVRPCVFACASADGYVYIFDLSLTTAAPVIVLDAQTTGEAGTNSRSQQVDSPGKSSTSKSRDAFSGRPALTGLAFNSRQRDLIAACDETGFVHIWRLGSLLANRNASDQTALDELVRLRE